MSFIYPRRVTISRPVSVDPSVGAQPYGGLSPSSETVIARNLPASIQFDRLGKPPLAGLPADAEGRGTWKLFIPLAKSPKPGMIQKRDVVTDDTGQRYAVINPYWNSLGFAGRIEELQT